ncbi:MAG: hypothetical protein CMP91_00080 [Gammaproteobacteria bacterium]|nr:hypothetical protein [Gammaproteobacteria bacterium]MAY03955.1 hypothetical protein [Gammaproteobacteria bacterium]|tara:strand:+ start:606 stop:920 length:315 start_codon:yes stop_codon:yes gene_type:complete
MNIIFYALVLFLTVGVAFSQTLLERIGLEPDYLLITLGAIVITGLLVYRGLLLVLLVAGLSVALNLPTELLQQYSIDRDILIVVLILMIVFPIGAKGMGRPSFN